MRVPVYSGEKIIEMADPARARRLSAGKNAKVVRERKSGIIVRVILKTMVLGDEKPGPHEDSRVPTYQEQLEPAPIPMLKLVDEAGVFRRWSSRDAFNPRRFNPDTLPRTAREMARL